MKIGLSSSGNEITSKFAQQFGRCPVFIIIDSETNEVTNSYPNQAQNAAGGAGIQAAQSLIDEKVEAVIAPQMGPNAFNVFTSAKIPIFTGINGTIEENIQAFNDKKLTEMTAAGGYGSGKGMGGGMGQGRGGGMGQGRGRRG